MIEPDTAMFFGETTAAAASCRQRVGDRKRRSWGFLPFSRLVFVASLLSIAPNVSAAASVTPAPVTAASVTATSVAATPLSAGVDAVDGVEPIDWEIVSRIRHEGLNNSQVMATLRHLTDEIGPRLTGSPALREANEWTRQKFAEWGLEARLDPWGPFGRGWSFDRAAVHVVTPRATPLLALPKAWTPGTRGEVRGRVVRATLEKEEDLEEWGGRLAGAIVLLDEPRAPSDPVAVEFSRYDSQGLEELARYPVREDRPDFRARARKRYEWRRRLNEFLVEQKVVATVEISDRDAGIVRVGGGGSWDPDRSPGTTGLVMAAEHYNLLSRWLEQGHEVTLEVEVEARFHDEDMMANNTVAEIPAVVAAAATTNSRRPGAALPASPEIVMVGAHLDSWHSGAGSNDNGAGVAVAMEAVRILRALGVTPKRTIRIALWTGEEQGLLGSRAYVEQHLAKRPEPVDPEIRALPRGLWPSTGPIEKLAEYERLSVYFNLDNGSGRIRGIYTQSNAAVQPLFERWLVPFADLGATTVTNRDTGGTDHQAFDAVGLPGFQFIQDGLDYTSRTHHTSLDHFDHARAEDLKQASVIMASFLYHAAMREERLPRKALPEG